MKTNLLVSLITTCFLFFHYPAHSQVYGEWQTVYTEGVNQKVQVSFMKIDCMKTHYRINNELTIPGGHLYFKIDYTDCKGRSGLTPVYLELDKPGIKTNDGWVIYGDNVKRLTPAEISKPKK